MKNFLVIALMVCSPFFIQAQSLHVNLGVKGGVNIASLDIENADYESLLSFYVGLLAHIHITEHFALQPELMFSGQGAKQTVAGTDYKIKLGYINIPVLGQVMFGKGFRLQTGPELGLLISGKTKVGDTEEDIKDDLKGINFAWVFGASFVTPSGFGFDARYNLGLSNINDASAQEIKNRVIALGVFYQFKHR